MSDLYGYDNRESCYQSQKTQTLDLLENDNYMNMILADISTQTPLSSFSSGFSQTGNKVWNYLYLERFIYLTCEILLNKILNIIAAFIQSIYGRKPLSDRLSDCPTFIF